MNAQAQARAGFWKAFTVAMLVATAVWLVVALAAAVAMGVVG